MRGIGCCKGNPRTEMEGTMVLFVFEASSPCGTTYRLGMAWYIPPALVSVIAALTRLF
jgi:hypothetical protein